MVELDAIFEQPNESSKSPLVILLHGHTGWKEEAHIICSAIIYSIEK